MLCVSLRPNDEVDLAVMNGSGRDEHGGATATTTASLPLFIFIFCFESAVQIKF
jgi:hypothetical protein